MELVKLLAINFKPQLKSIKQCVIEVGNITVEFHTTSEKSSVELIVSARIKLDKCPKITSKGYIIITKKDVKPLEFAIESVVNIFAVSERVSRNIFATYPSIAFNPENDNERKWLESTNGVFTNNQKRIILETTTKIDFKLCLNSLSDRLDGVLLLSEALSSSSNTGKFHDYFRLFERAFKLSSKKLISPLFAFLSKTGLQYQEKEIESWVAIRHSVTHADLKESFLIESDVTPVIRRIEQAAYDVLFNKSIWRSTSQERKNIYKTEFGMYKPNDLLITRGSAGGIIIQVLDETYSYKQMIDKPLDVLPNNWWAKVNPDFRFKVPLGKIVDKS